MLTGLIVGKGEGDGRRRRGRRNKKVSGGWEKGRRKEKSAARTIEKDEVKEERNDKEKVKV